MPFVEADPWRLQYFTAVACPPDVRIPTEDPDAYQWYPAAPLGLQQARGGGVAGDYLRPARRAAARFSGLQQAHHESARHGRRHAHADRCARTTIGTATSGHMWMTLLEGEHVSTDAAVRQGQVHWWRHSLGTTAPRGTFEHWTIEARARPELEAYLGGWIGRHLAGYYRHAQPRDDRLAHHRCTPALRRSVARPEWTRLAGCRGRAVRAAASGSSPTVSAATVTVSCSSGRTSREYRYPPAELVAEVRRHARRDQRADHVPRRPSGRDRTPCPRGASGSRS